MSIAIGLLFLCAATALAITDLLSEVRFREREAQVANLKNELAQFVMALREEDGLPLLENAEASSRTERPIQVLKWNKPLFTFFLQQSNIRKFRTANIRWEVPQSCITEFSNANERFRVQLCVTVFPNDPAGRYIYFSTIYPDNRVVEHLRGRGLQNVDRIRLSVQGRKVTAIDLVFERPRYIEAYPGRASNFAGFHQVTGYGTGSMATPLRGIQAQAFERAMLDAEGVERNHVLVVGRIDSSLIVHPVIEALEWPSREIEQLRFGVEIANADGIREEAVNEISVPIGAVGKTGRSLERLYVAQVMSRAQIDIESLAPGQVRKVWSSANVGASSHLVRRAGPIQRVSDWWARLLGSIVSGPSEALQIQLPIDGSKKFVGNIRAERRNITDVAARAIFYISVTVILVVALVLVAGMTMRQLAAITRKAYAMTIHESAQSLQAPRGPVRSEIDVLAKTMDALLKRSRARGEKLHQIKRREILLAQQQVKSRQALLDAIGHEIKSPLQTLSTEFPWQSETGGLVQRMVRAVDALFDATSIESAFQNGTIVCKVDDLAAYLFRLVENLHRKSVEIRFVGPANGVYAYFDPISFDAVLDHLIDNACRFKRDDTVVIIELVQDGQDLHVEVSNEGPEIPKESLERIFNLGYSTTLDPNNRGLGLYAVRSYVGGMRGTVHAENRVGRVTFVISLQRRTHHSSMNA
jgi:signal transduction histidine kinase